MHTHQPHSGCSGVHAPQSQRGFINACIRVCYSACITAWSIIPVTRLPQQLTGLAARLSEQAPSHHRRMGQRRY